MTLHIVVCGDCIEFLKSNPFKQGLHLVVTSPPYFNARAYSQYETYEVYLQFMREVIQLIFTSLVDGGYFCLNASSITIKRKLYPISIDLLNISREVGFELEWDVSWVKPLHTQGLWRSSDYNYRHPYPFEFYLNSFHEEIWILKKPGERELLNENIELSKIVPKDKQMRYSYKTWFMEPASPGKEAHSAPYPLELPLRCIELFSLVGDIIYDPFGGSGTTALAAVKSKRNSYITEMNKEFIPLIYRKIGADSKSFDDYEVRFENISKADILEIEKEIKKRLAQQAKDKKKKAARKKYPTINDITDYF